MKIKKVTAVMLIAAILFFSVPGKVKATGIPVFDALRYAEEAAAHLLKMLKLKRIIELVRQVKRIEEETRDFFNKIYDIMKGSELIDAKELLWQILNSTYMRDIKKNDPWWVVWNTDATLPELFPELSDYSYITDSYLYKHNAEHRAYADKVIAQLKEKEKELENLKEHLKLMRKYDKNFLHVRMFANRLKEYSQANNIGKMIGLLANLELLNARLILTLNFNRRVMMTLLLKEDVWNSMGQNLELQRDQWSVGE